MLNIDDRILASGITPDQLFLLCHIAKHMNRDLTCFPSNATLCMSTAWSLSKLKEVKKSLIVDGYLSAKERYNDKGQTTNLYTIKTEYLSVWTNLAGKGDNDTPARNAATPGQKSGHPPAGNAATEVLTNEVLISSSFTAEQKLKIWADEIRSNPSTKKAYTRARGLKIENFENDFERWLAEAEASPEQYENRAAAVKHFLNYACQSFEKSQKKYTGPGGQYPAKTNKLRTIEVDPSGYLPEDQQLF